MADGSLVTEQELTVCTGCGHAYEPADSTNCGSCPLNFRCSLGCCPHCGLGSVDAQHSWVGRLVSFVAHRRNAQADLPAEAALAAFPSGSDVVVSGLDGIPPHRRRRLGAYGIELGRRLVVRHAAAGVTIVRVGSTELAFEADLAGQILAKPVTEGSR